MRHILALAALALAGCGTFTNVEFDAQEAVRYSDIAAVADRASLHCNDPGKILQISYMIETQARLASRYSSVKNNNKRAADAGDIVHQFAVDLNTRYLNGSPSEAYCLLKLANIEQAADIVARSISKKEQNAPFQIP